MPVRPLRHTRAHDYKLLCRRWRRLASPACLTVQAYAVSGGYELICLSSRRPRPETPSVYFSAGIHGDEPASTEALIEWAEDHTELLRGMNVLVFPCLNPWGLVNNCRRDIDGRDLNRSFHTSAVPQIAAQMQLLTGRAFDLALILHEDYDAVGLYLYEVPRQRPFWGEQLVAAAARHIPADPRVKIEGRASREGVVRRAIRPGLMPEWPEAFVLHFQSAARVFTVETPSEFHLDDRVAAQVAVVNRAIALCRSEFSLRRASAKA